MPQTASKKLSVMTLALMTVAAVVSLRGLPLMATEGLSMLFYIGFCAIFFLIPASLVSAELGGAFSDTQGGVYSWVSAAFGPRWGFVAIWLQWIQNVVWYPTVLAFAAGALAYLFLKPEMAGLGWFNTVIILVIYWAATFMTLQGAGFAAKMTKWFMLLGTVLPGLLIIGLGIVWVAQGNPIEFLKEADPSGTSISEELSHARLFPHITGLSSIAFLGGILLLFAGIEAQAVHANDLANPSRDYPKSMFVAAIIIFALFTMGSLAVAAVVPADQISLNAGLMQAFESLLTKFGLQFFTPIIGLFVAFGAIGGVMAWIGGPSRGLLQTAQEGEIPPFLAKTNHHGVQVTILMVQGAIVTALAMIYLIFTDVSVAFFVLSAMTIALYLVMYMLMYGAAIKLRKTRPDLPRTYKIPGGMAGMIAVAGVGFIAVFFAFVVGFFPPAQLKVGSPTTYVALVAGGLIVFVGLPLLINAFKKPSWRQSQG
ncbi:Glutamate/gamma-aminobutyrate antiporter [Roseovarius albus]|uniref:Glutamate/gamma-aminobutyrate antiporter n=1 Tax=Roseovarius albus TaxID=1247867 RepID=A0A1X6ZEI1_9RHOB|nr:amino acid permease [Roseovarius albus]SLN47327.1 Glutamate/gamma-aminobutyrate antiporter [Roseovarius albus]